MTVFMSLSESEGKRLKWLVGFFVGHHVVRPTFENRKTWDKQQIVESLQGKYFGAIYEKFYSWMQEKHDKQEKIEDAAIFIRMAASEKLKIEIEALMYLKIPEMAEKYNDERNGLTTRRMIKEQVTTDEWKEILVRFDNTCAYCGSNKDLTQDHIKAISKGGKHEVNNLVPACKTCNSSKGNRDVGEWYLSRTFYDFEKYKKIIRHNEGD